MQEEVKEIRISSELEDEAMTMDALVDSYFKEDQQRKRFKLEMSELIEQETKIGVKVRLDGSPYFRQLGVIVSVDLIKIQEKNSKDKENINNNKKDQKDDHLDIKNTTDKTKTPVIQSLSFEIQPHHTNYPKKSMRIYALDDFKGLNDGRDYLKDILGHSWHSSIRLIEIAECLVSFTETLMKNQTNAVYLQRLGKHYIGQIYRREHLQHFCSLILVPCTLYASETLNKPSTGLVTLSNYQLCVYEVTFEKQSNKIYNEYLKLVFCGDLQSIVEIKRNRTNRFIIHIRYQSEASNPPFNFQHSLRVSDSDAFLKILLEKAGSIQKIKVWSNSAVILPGSKQLRDQKMIAQDTLTQRAYYQEEQYKIKRCPENFNRITHTYNDLIEHYSSVNDFILADYFLKVFHRVCQENEDLDGKEKEGKLEGEKNNQSGGDKGKGIQKQQENTQKQNILEGKEGQLIGKH